MNNIRAEVLGERQLDARFARLGNALNDFSPVLEKLGLEFYRIEEEQFATEGQGRWKALSEKYEKRKKQLYGDKTILRASDTMYEAMTVEGAPYNVHRVRETEAEFGVEGLRYPALHQVGKGKLPRRKVIDLRSADRERMRRVAQKELAAMVKRSGFEVS